MQACAQQFPQQFFQVAAPVAQPAAWPMMGVLEGPAQPQMWQPAAAGAMGHVTPGFAQQVVMPHTAAPLPQQQEAAAVVIQGFPAQVHAAPSALPSTMLAASPSTVPPLASAGTKPAVDVNEVLQAVESLYQDQLQPYGRILRKRLAE